MLDDLVADFAETVRLPDHVMNSVDPQQVGLELTLPAGGQEKFRYLVFSFPDPPGDSPAAQLVQAEGRENRIELKTLYFLHAVLSSLCGCHLASKPEQAALERFARIRVIVNHQNIE